eukprot:352507-Chlamydomonas_euryale.AAC.21
MAHKNGGKQTAVAAAEGSASLRAASRLEQVWAGGHCGCVLAARAAGRPCCPVGSRGELVSERLVCAGKDLQSMCDRHGFSQERRPGVHGLCIPAIRLAVVAGCQAYECVEAFLGIWPRQTSMTLDQAKANATLVFVAVLS